MTELLYTQTINIIYRSNNCHYSQEYNYLKINQKINDKPVTIFYYNYQLVQLATCCLLQTNTN